MDDQDEIVFDVCKQVANQFERLPNPEYWRFVVQFIEVRLQQKQREMYEKERMNYASQLGAVPIRPNGGL